MVSKRCSISFIKVSHTLTYDKNMERKKAGKSEIWGILSLGEGTIVLMFSVLDGLLVD